MKRSTFIHTIRTIYRNKFSTLINLFGLSVGIAVVLLISVYLKNELTADKVHENYNNIYLFGANTFNGTSDMPGPLAEMVAEKVPEVDLISRVDFTNSWGMDIKHGNDHLNIKGLIFADPTLLKIFSFKGIQGDYDNALTAPNSIVLTKTLAYSIFGEEQAIGKQILLQNKELLTVTAVIEDVPSNSSIDFKGIISMPVLKNIANDDYSKAWGNFNYPTFCTTKLKDIKSIEAKVNDSFHQIQADREGTVFSLLPFSELYFHNPYKDSILKRGSLQTVLFLSASVLLIILLAVTNYLNLSIASISSHLRSVGIQKITGAKKRNIYQHFFNEAAVIVFASGLFGLIIAGTLLPTLNHLTLSNIPKSQLYNFNELLFLAFSLLLLAGLSSYVPYVIINKQNLQSILKNQMQVGEKKSKVKYALVAFQFAITIVLIIVSITVNKQINFINTTDLGFNKDDTTILFSLEDKPTENYNLLRSQLSQYPQIKTMSLSHSTPGTVGMQWGGSLNFRGETKSISYYSVPVTPGYLEMMGYQIKEGRFFSDSISTDKGCFILNEAAVKKYGIAEAPLEAKISNFDPDIGKIIGVVKDFNYESLREEVKPLAFCYIPQWTMCSLVNIRVNSEDLASTKKIIQSEYNKLIPEKTFECFTIKDILSEYYTKDNNFNIIILSFSILSILIGCLGMIGIVNITIISKTKEIGVRKVNGAKVSEVLTMLNRDFVKWVAIAFIIATPIAYYAMNKWLENFAYKTTLSWWIFALAGMLALGIALLTVSFQSWKAATKNPVESLRYE